MKSVSLKLSVVLIAATLGIVSFVPAGATPATPKVHEVSVEATNKALITQLSAALLRRDSDHDLGRYFAPDHDRP